jgi:hypothetical protein
LENFGAVIGQAGDVVAALFNFGDAAIYVDQLCLAIRAPVGRPKEEKNETVLAHEIGQLMGFAGLIDARADVGRRGADRRS